MSEFNLFKCPQFLENVATEPARQIGITLGNIFYAIFSPINFPIEKLKIKQSENLKKYELDIKTELNKIPEEKLVEPKLSIIGPAIEASKFYIEEEEMRKMFAKLISSSINSDTSSKAHHSFVEIIKQLSPLDASNLRIIFQNSFLPIGKYVITKKNNKATAMLEDLFLSNPTNTDICSQASSITNLVRLGLIRLDYTQQLTNESSYLVFKEHPVYLERLKEISENKNSNCTLIDIQKGVIELTYLGKDFATICL